MKNHEFATKWGELGPIYGAQWRAWRDYKLEIKNNPDGTKGFEPTRIDQIQNLINDLKTNPDSRR